jgi:diaminopimelate epimerase
MKTRIPFSKMAGAGNDFVLIDTIHSRLTPLRAQWPRVARALSGQGEGVRTDGLLVLERSTAADIRMRIFNPDGSEPSMCGNGIRCLAWYAHRCGVAKPTMTIETKSGIKRAEIQAPNRVRIDMGTPRVLTPPRVGGLGILYADHIASGVPHLVCWVRDVAKVNVNRLGRRLRYHPRFQPEGTNVDFVEKRRWRHGYDQRLGWPVHRVTLEMRTYERGVEGETRACGTGAVAAATSIVCSTPFSPQDALHDPLFVGRESNLERFAVDVRVPGGTLRVELGARYLIDEHRLVFSHAFLEGEAREVSTGTFLWNGRSPS